MIKCFIRKVKMQFSWGIRWSCSYILTTGLKILFDGANLSAVSVFCLDDDRFEIILKCLNKMSLGARCCCLDGTLPESIPNLSPWHPNSEDKDTCSFATRPRTISPSGRGVCGLQSASITISTISRTTGALSTSVYSSTTKNKFIKSHPVLRCSAK
jgi:hypothetical protein